METDSADRTRTRSPANSAGTVVLAGGRGFIGTHLAPALAAAGYQVVILSRGTHANTPHARFTQWNAGQPGAWQKALSGAAAVINLCGASIAGGRWSDRRKRVLLDSRTQPSRALVEACASLTEPPGVLMQASGVGFYGTGEPERWEDAPPGDDFLATLAEAWEAPLDAAAIPTTRLRFGVVLARDGGALGRMLLPFRLWAGGPVAGGRQWLSWIHVQDVVEAVLFLLRRPPIAAVNVTSPQPVRNAEFARIAGRVLGRPALLPLPRFVLQAVLGEQATLVCDGQRALPAALQREGFSFRFPDLHTALEDLCR